MDVPYVVLFAANLPQATPQSTNSFPIGDVRNCPVSQRWGNDAPLYRITALPGSGFDNLRNLDMGEVFFFNYSTCKISNDGKYLLPDSISLFPILESKIDLYSEFFDHWDDYTSMTSSSINLEMGTFFSNIDRKLSSEYGTIKSRQVNDNSKTARALIKSRLYTVKMHATRQPAPPSIQVEGICLVECTHHLRIQSLVPQGVQSVFALVWMLSRDPNIPSLLLYLIAAKRATPLPMVYQWIRDEPFRLAQPLPSRLHSTHVNCGQRL